MLVAAARLGLDAIFITNRGGFNLRIRIERANLGHACIVPPRQLLNRPVRIVGHFRDTDGTPFPMHVRQFPVELVIEAEDIRFALVINDARMVA